MSALRAEDIIRLFEEDAKARKRLAELLVMDEDVRLAIINAVVRDVATKSDIERVMREVNRLSVEVSALRERVARVEGALTQLVERVNSLERSIEARIMDVDKRIDALDKRMDEFGKRLDYMTRLTLILTGSVIAMLTVSIITTVILRLTAGLG